MSFWHTFFGWYDGQVWPNLAASLIWGVPAGWKLFRSHKKLRRSQAEMHAKLDALHRFHGIEMEPNRVRSQLPRRGHDHQSPPQP